MLLFQMNVLSNSNLLCLQRWAAFTIDSAYIYLIKKMQLLLFSYLTMPIRHFGLILINRSALVYMHF